MKNQNIQKLKKYLFFISIVFFAITFFHLSYSYIYENSKSKPVIGWSISEWLVWDFPSLNPLKVLHGNNKYVLGLVYRSILKYDLQQQKIVWDIANCDISSLVNIECVINSNALWSNGEKIKADDIVSTYNLIKETKSNPIIVSLLEWVKIESKDNLIVFKNTKKDVNFLNVFFQPIISQETINNLSQENIKGSFPYQDGIYSWNYTISAVNSDQNLWVTKITLDKNEKYGKTNISKIVLYIFPDENSLIRNKQSITVFNDTNNIIWESISRMKSNKYSLPQFVSLFLNTWNIKNINLRNFIINEIQVENLISLLWKENYKQVTNPYLTKEKIKLDSKAKNFQAVMSWLWYKKKSVLLDDLKSNTTNTTQTSSWTTEKTENKISIPSFSDINWKRYQKKSKFIIDPSYVDRYNFVTKDDILLKWIGTEKIKEVYVNDYKLSWFKANNKNFYYRLSERYKSIKQWLNTYKIYFVNNKWEKSLKETLYFLYYKDRKKLQEEKQKLLEKIYDEEKQEIEKKQKEIQKQEQTKPQTTTKKIDTKRLEKIEALDDKLYYDNSLQPFKLHLIYLNSRKDFDQTANFIQKSLKEIWITTELSALNKTEFWKAIISKDYDMIIWWIDSGFFTFNLFPYFHSSQEKTWFNYSNIKKTSLDVILEELKENIYTEEKTKKLQQDALKVIQKEQIIKTLYTPKSSLLIDKSIKLENNFDYLPDTTLRSEVIENLYLKQQKEFSLQGKSIIWFIKYIAKKLYE